MTKEDFEKEANKWADDMVWALVDTKREANDDERDFLVQEYKDLQKHFTKELEKEKAELKADNDARKFAMVMSEKVEKQLREENAELEKENKTVSRKGNEAIADKLLITAKYNEVLNDLNQENDKLQKENKSLENVKNIYISDLLKAKEIIKKLRGLYFSPVVTKDDVKRQDEILAEAEQFLKEVEE